MLATFVELPPFERIRNDYMDDEAYNALQIELMGNPEADDLTPDQRKALKHMLKRELDQRTPRER